MCPNATPEDPFVPIRFPSFREISKTDANLLLVDEPRPRMDIGDSTLQVKER